MAERTVNGAAGRVFEIAKMIKGIISTIRSSSNSNRDVKRGELV